MGRFKYFLDSRVMMKNLHNYKREEISPYLYNFTITQYLFGFLVLVCTVAIFTQKQVWLKYNFIYKCAQSCKVVTTGTAPCL